MKHWLALFAVLPLVAVSAGSSATAGAAAPPRNGLIAVSGQDGIRIVDPRTGSARLLPKTEGMDDAAWSPDGSRLAVTEWDDAGDFNVSTMKPDGSDRQIVVRDAGSPSWSPDGKWLAVVRETYGGGTRTALLLVKADGSEVREIHLGGDAESAYVSQPAWSPDGKLIAFVDAAGRIRLVTPSGEAGPEGPAGSGTGSVSWSPDSSKVAFDRYAKERNRQIVVVFEVQTGRETILRGRQGGSGAPGWSPDGKQLAFVAMGAMTSAAGGGCGGNMAAHLWAMAADGTRAHRVVKGNDYYGSPSWAPSLEPEPPPTD